MGILRFILAASVVLWHVPGHGFVGIHAGVSVLCFYIISGFYMSLIVNQKYSLCPDGKSRFYMSRVMRLFPIYIAFVCIELLWFIATNSPTVFTQNTGLDLTSRMFLIGTNLFIFGQDMFQVVIEHGRNGGLSNAFPTSWINATVEFFGKNTFTQGNILVGQAWTLAVEFWFYLLAPFIVRSRLRILILLFLTVLLRIYFMHDESDFPNDPWRYRFFPGVLVFFLLGCVAYLLYRKIADSPFSRTIGWLAALLLSVFLVYSVVEHGGVFLFQEKENYDEIRLWIFYVLFTLSLPFWFIISKRSKWDNFIGELSYPIYIVHGLVIGIVVQHINYAYLNQTLLIVVITVAFAIFLNKKVQAPIDNVRSHLSDPAERLTSGTPKRFLALGGAFFCSVLVALGLTPTTTATSSDATAVLEQAYLVKVVRNYNIVSFAGHYYAVPHGISVEWGKVDASAIPGVKTARTMESAIYAVEMSN